MLIKLVDILAGPLTLLMTVSLEHGALLKNWKDTFVSPMYKKGATNLAEDHRKISLTSIVCKLMEKWLNMQSCPTSGRITCFSISSFDSSVEYQLSPSFRTITADVQT